MTGEEIGEAEPEQAVVLETSSLAVGYGSLSVARDLNIRIRAGELVGLLGPNGTGKTTTLLTLGGELQPLRGQVTFLGRNTSAPLFRRSRSGLALVTERSVFAGMTVAENLRVSRVKGDYAFDLFPELSSRRDVRVGLLSGGEQQMMSLACALGREPKLLLADELSLGLAPRVVERLLAAVRSAADHDGVAAMIVEQHVHRVLDAADRVYVLGRGGIVMEGTSAALKDRLEEIRNAYLTGDVSPAEVDGRVLLTGEGSDFGG